MLSCSGRRAKGYGRVVAERVARSTWSIQGETITLPVTITDARITAAVFRAAPAAAAQVLAETPLRPLVRAGRAYSMLMCVHYGEWALKSYDEVGVGLLAQGPGGRTGLHLVDLPVTGQFTCEAGQDFWALPKWIMDADLRFGPDATSVVVREGDSEVMRAEFRHAGRTLPVPIRASMPAWSYLPYGAQAGRLLRGRVPMRLSGVRMGRAGFSVRLGTGAMAARMEALGMLGRPLLMVHADRLSGPMGEFEAV
jgi:hypothetical protein